LRHKNVSGKGLESRSAKFYRDAAKAAMGLWAKILCFWNGDEDRAFDRIKVKRVYRR